MQNLQFHNSYYEIYSDSVGFTAAEDQKNKVFSVWESKSVKKYVYQLCNFVKLMDYGVNYNQKCWAHLAGLIKIMENYDKKYILLWYDDISLFAFPLLSHLDEWF